MPIPSIPNLGPGTRKFSLPNFQTLHNFCPVLRIRHSEADVFTRVSQHGSSAVSGYYPMDNTAAAAAAAAAIVEPALAGHG
jgi:hypothetical protein